MIRILIAILMVGTFAQAKTAANPKELKQVLSQFIDLSGQGNTAKGYPMLREYLPVDQATFDKMTVEFKAELEKYAAKYGKYEGQRIVSEKSLGDDLHRVTYMMKHVNHPVMVDFYLYKTKAGWIVDSFSWNSSIKLFFTE